MQLLIFGIRHFMVLLYFQIINNCITIINEVVETGNNLGYYIDKLQGVKGVILPHDAEVKELISGTTRKEEFDKSGLNALILPRSEVSAGISKVLQFLPTLKIDRKCKYLISCITNYSKDKRKADYVEIPRQDRYTDGADALRYLIEGHKEFNYTSQTIKHTGL